MTTRGLSGRRRACCWSWSAACSGSWSGAWWARPRAGPGGGRRALATRLASATVAVRAAGSSDRGCPAGAATAVLELRNDSRLPATLLLVEDRCHPSLAEVAALRGARPAARPHDRAALRDPRHRPPGATRSGPSPCASATPSAWPSGCATTPRPARCSCTRASSALADGTAAAACRGTGSSDAPAGYAAGDEFYTMREYVQGDDLRHVHWPSTAHRQTLMVRQQEMPWQAQAVVFCDARARRALRVRRAVGAGEGDLDGRQRAAGTWPSAATRCAPPRSSRSCPSPGALGRPDRAPRRAARRRATSTWRPCWTAARGGGEGLFVRRARAAAGRRRHHPAPPTCAPCSRRGAATPTASRW